MGKHYNVINKPATGFKRCSKCHVVKEATTEFFGQNSGLRGGLTWYCKECTARINKERYDADREGIIKMVIKSQKISALVNINGKRVKPGAPCTLTRTEWIESIDYFNGLDAYTGRPMIRLAMDHVVPLSKFGGHEKYNVVPCDGPINLWKHDDDMEEWYRKEIFFDEDRLAKIKEWMSRRNLNVEQTDNQAGEICSRVI